MAADGGVVMGDHSMQNDGIFKDVYFTIIPSVDLRVDAAHRVQQVYRFLSVV